MTDKDKEIAERFVRLIETEFIPDEVETLIPVLGNYYASFCARSIVALLKSHGSTIDAEDVKKKAAIFGGAIEDNIKTHVQILTRNGGTDTWQPSDN